ncbi:MAG: TIGR04282 family arsenosugar biosynthesis glycosyltransferase [Hyphomicrobiaceae bacterium]
MMARAPAAGRVKTRLARELGTGAATRFARHALHTLLLRVGRDQRWQTFVAATPDASVTERCWPCKASRMPQGRGNLGQRMQRLMRRAPPGPAVIIGTDIPGIRAEHIARAFRLLGSHDAVFGPAADGGYWLVGLRRLPRVLGPFAGVRWSTPHALADTLANLEGRTVAFVASLDDVDDARALRAASPGVGRCVLPAVGRLVSATR